MSFRPSHHGTEREEVEWDQKKKTWNQEDFKLEWIYALGVPWRSLFESEREREKERERATHHNQITRKRKRKEKSYA